MTYEIIIGIDPGKKGAIAIFSNNNIDTFTIPLIENEIDEKSLFNLFIEFNNSNCMAFLEKVHSMPKQGVASTFTFGMGYGLIKMALTGNNIPYQLVTPQAWKKKILAGLPSEKSSAILYVNRKYPTVSLIPKGKRTPSDGIADAICIAEYGKTLI